MNRVLTAGWAELVQLNAVRIITTVFTRDVVTSFAVATGECDLWTDVGTFFCHSATPSLVGGHIPQVAKHVCSNFFET